MENPTHVVLSIKQYEVLLTFLSDTQIYKHVAQLIADTVNEVNSNIQTFIVTPRVAEPTTPEPVELKPLKGNKNDNEIK